MHTTEPSSLALRLAQWLDARLELTACIAAPSPQFYGIEVLDPLGIERPEADGVRTMFLGGVDDADITVAAGRFDAVAAVSHRWMPAVPLSSRPGMFVGRRRVRTVRVLVGSTWAGVARFDDDPVPVVLPTVAPPVA